jgi:hypothetical protein
LWTRSERPEIAVTRRVVRAFEVHPPIAKQSRDYLDRFLEAANTVVEGQAKRARLRFGISSTKAQHQPTTTDLVNGIRNLGQHRWVPKGGAADKRSELNAGGDRR